MEKTLDRIDVTKEYKHLQIIEKTDSGENFRRVLTPDQDVSGESETVQEKAEGLWTNEVKDKWATFQEEQEES